VGSRQPAVHDSRREERPRSRPEGRRASRYRDKNVERPRAHQREASVSVAREFLDRVVRPIVDDWRRSPLDARLAKPAANELNNLAERAFRHWPAGAPASSRSSRSGARALALKPGAPAPRATREDVRVVEEAIEQRGDDHPLDLLRSP